MPIKPPTPKTPTVGKETVNAIRNAYHNHKKSMQQIADFYGISKGLVQRVIHGLGGYKDI